MKNGLSVLLAILCLVACSDGKYETSGDVVNLVISFDDPRWDGKNIPEIGQCTDCGGGGFSPPLLVRNIPQGTDMLVVEYKDKTMTVFHGAIKYRVTRQPKLVIPSFPEQTFDLPPGFELETEHNAPIGKRGAYIAPCGCGYRNKYIATVYAVQKRNSDRMYLLGKGKIGLGRF